MLFLSQEKNKQNLISKNQERIDHEFKRTAMKKLTKYFSINIRQTDVLAHHPWMIAS